MSGTSVISSNQESCNPYDAHYVKRGYKGHGGAELLQQQACDRSQKTTVNILNVRDNKSPNYCLDKLDIGLPTTKRQLHDESDLINLLESFEEGPYYKYLIDNDLGAIDSKKIQEYWDQFYSFPRLFAIEQDTTGDGKHQQEPFVLQPSLFHKNNVPPTIYFKTKLATESRPPVGLPKCLQHLFKWKISSITPNTIRNCILFMKFETIRPSNSVDNSYLGSWCKHMPTTDFSNLDEWRKVNHYPGSFHMGRKDKLWTRLKLASEKFDDFELFHPITFVLPKDYDELSKYWSSSPSNLFIMKPPASARGNGVQVINDISQIPSSALSLPQAVEGSTTKKSTIIVQQYISNPCLLENGQKFDLRVYVLITSVDPLRIYVYEEGLVRFASSKYTNQEDGIIDQYMHLTNYFVNKNNQEYKINNDCESPRGCKWTLKRFWRYLKEHHSHVDVDGLRKKINDIIVRTIISCENPMSRFSHQNCKNDYSSYELFGFDIILDEDFKPWILEVNITPSLKSESLLDSSVKFRVIQDMFNLVGYNLPPLNDETRVGLGQLQGHKLFFDRRLYTSNITKIDKLKHVKFQKLFKVEEIRRASLQHQQTDTSHPTQRSESAQSNDVPAAIVTSQVSGNKGRSESSDTQQQEDESNENNQSIEGNLDHYSDDDSHRSSRRLINNDSILSDLTQSDIRVLMLAEDELSRCGQFKRVFPCATSGHYLKYFDKPRYYNLLLDAWEQRYHNNRMEGIRILSKSASFMS